MSSVHSKVFPCQPLRRQITAAAGMGPFAAVAESRGIEPGVLLVLLGPGGML